MYHLGLCCSLHALGLSAALQRMCVCSVHVTLRFLPAYAIILYLLSISVCGRKPAGTEETPKQSKESPTKSDSNGDCKWTTGSGRFGTMPPTIWFRSKSTGGQKVRDYAGCLVKMKKKQAAVANWRSWTQELSNVVLCEEKGADCVISTPIFGSSVKNSVDKSVVDDRLLGVCRRPRRHESACQHACMILKSDQRIWRR